MGQTQAERLSAGILAIEGFSAVDPQHPLGGPDGLKDMICRRGVTRFVAAAYFPTSPKPFNEVLDKFRHDLAGVAANSANGFVFIANQLLTVGQRKELQKVGRGSAEVVEIYHLERLRAVLDSPVGCGLRMEYLRIPMTEAEQVAFWSSANGDIASRLSRIEERQVQMLQKLDADTALLLNRTTAMIMDLKSDPSSTFTPGGGVPTNPQGGPATASIDIPQLLWLHRIVMVESSTLPNALTGVLRTINVSVESGDPSTGVFLPPAPAELPGLLEAWCESWRAGYNELLGSDHDARLDGICEAYYNFLCIHPFTDGNGRMGRVLLDQMIRELLGATLSPGFADARMELQDALREGSSTDLARLRALLSASIE